MKIVIVGPAYPYRGGIADTNQSFALAMQSLGHEVVIHTFTVQYPQLLFPGKSQFSEDPAPTNLTIKRSINSINPFNWFSAAKQLKDEKADLVVVRYWTPLLAPALGFITAQINKTVKCIALCDNIIPHEKKFYDKALTSYFTKQFHGFITFSDQVKSELAAFSNKQTLVHSHPINLNLGEEINKKLAKEKLKLSSKTHYLLFFGLVRKYKGLDLMLEAIANLKRFAEEKNIKLLVVGEFYDDPEIYLKMIRELKIEHLVEIRNEFVPTEEVKYYFSAADLITQTYHTASQSGITQMAINFNKATLVTNVGGLSEIIEHNKSGYVVEKDSSAIATAIEDFYVNEKETSFSEQAKAKKSSYSWENFCKELIDFAQNIKI